MAEHPMIRGRTTAERNASIEAILKSISRRATRRAVVYIPPVPFLVRCDEVPQSGTLGKFITPFSGTLKGLFIRSEELHTNRVVIALAITSDIAKTTMNFTLTKRVEHLDVELEVDAGALIAVTLEEGGLHGVDIATAIYPRLENHKAQQYLLDEILAQEKEESDALQEAEKS